MRTIKLISIVALLVLSGACAKQDAKVAVTGVTVTPQSMELSLGETAELTAEVSPSNASDKTLSWLSSNPSVVYVKDGGLMALAAGTADVTATTIDGGYQAICKVTVKDDIAPVPVLPTNIMLNYSEYELLIGGTVTLVASVLPANADDLTVQWSTSDEKVATVDAGIVTAVGSGVAVITAKTNAGDLKATCTITVIDKDKIESDGHDDLITDEIDW